MSRAPAEGNPGSPASASCSTTSAVDATTALGRLPPEGPPRAVLEVGGAPPSAHDAVLRDFGRSGQPANPTAVVDRHRIHRPEPGTLWGTTIQDVAG